MLLNISLTMITALIVAYSVGGLIFCGLAIWNMIHDHID
jgi:hypothetical protein